MIKRRAVVLSYLILNGIVGQQCRRGWHTEGAKLIHTWQRHEVMVHMAAVISCNRTWEGPIYSQGRPAWLQPLYPMDMRESGQKDLEPNMQTNRKTTANEATRMSGRISEIRDINVIKLIPWRHQLLYLLDVISWLLEAVRFLLVPATHRTRVRESDPRREQPPMRRKRRRKKSTTSIQSSSRYFQPQHPCR